MADSNLFRWLVEYHCTYNLPESLSYIQEGKGYTQKGRLLREGSDKGQNYTGLLIVANGSTLFDRLYADEIILDEETDPAVPVPVKELFFNYLLRQQYNDGAYVFNGTTQEMTRVYELNNNPQSLQKNLRLEELLPVDFVYEDGRQVLRQDLGTKTRLAIKLPHAYQNCRTFQIKQSAYTPLGMGKVTHFEKEGLVEEFFFRYAPESEWPFIDERQKIVGVYRKYENRGGKVVRISETLWDSEKIKEGTEDAVSKEDCCGLEKCVNC